MGSHRVEDAQPVDWLRELEGQPGGLNRLIEESGSLVFAAWRVARARCRTGADAPLPTIAQVVCVAREIAERVGYYDTVPSAAALADECVRRGVPIASARRRAA